MKIDRQLDQDNGIHDRQMDSLRKHMGQNETEVYADYRDRDRENTENKKFIRIDSQVKHHEALEREKENKETQLVDDL